MFDVHGNFFNTYPEKDKFTYNPWSRDYVNPNGDHYAQKHPDEDFAETFTVWLTPRSGWRSSYQALPTRAAQIALCRQNGQRARARTAACRSQHRLDARTITNHEDDGGAVYGAKPNRYYSKSTGYVDPDLKDIFRKQPRSANRRALFRDYARADVFLKEQKQSLLTRVAYWVGVDTTVVADLLDKLINRTRALNLWLDRTRHKKKAGRDHQLYQCVVHKLQDARHISAIDRSRALLLRRRLRRTANSREVLYNLGMCAVSHRILGLSPRLHCSRDVFPRVCRRRLPCNRCSVFAVPQPRLSLTIRQER